MKISTVTIRTLKTTLKQVGSLLMVIGAVVAIPSVVSAIYKEWYSVTGFLSSAVVIAGVGLALYKNFYDAENVKFRNSLIVLATGWLFIAFAGAIPFYVIAHITPPNVLKSFVPKGAPYSISSLSYLKDPIHCLFESMSAYTTTGLTMVKHEPSVGKGILFYRSIAQWFGGAGFIVMVLAVFRQTSVRSAILMYGSEASGQKIKPRIIETARSIWRVYLFITLFSILYLAVGTYFILPGYPLEDIIFNSINHGLTGQSTGGFSTLDQSIGSYHSRAMEILHIFPMILGAFAIPFYYKLIFEGRINLLWKDLQTRYLIIAFIIGSSIQSWFLYRADLIDTPVREGVFQFISAMSTTGWQTSHIDYWNRLSVVFIVITAMFIGGASGATVGGIKMIRALLIGKGIRWQVNRVILSEHTVKKIKFNGHNFLPREMNEEFTKAATLAFVYMLLMVVSAVICFLIIDNKFTFEDALFESASAQGTVGLTTGITGPGMPRSVEFIYIFQMWAGRLEIVPVFAFFRAIVFGLNPNTI